MDEATTKDTDTGQVVDGEGWFVRNLGDASWERDSDNGVWCAFEAPDAPFAQYGANVHIVKPGQPNGRYHSESEQEGFLVLAGECIAVVEGQERRLRQWDYLHCPAGTNHILIGAGDGPCAIFMTGGRSPESSVHYPVDAVAARYGASVAKATDSATEAYADQARTITRERAPWPPARTAELDARWLLATVMCAGQATAEAPQGPFEESPDTIGRGGRETDPGKPAGKCHRNTPPMAGAPRESRNRQG